MRILARIVAVLTALSAVVIVALASFGGITALSGPTAVVVNALYVAVLLIGAFVLWTAFDRPTNNAKRVALGLVALHWIVAAVSTLRSLLDDVGEGIGESLANVGVVALCAFAAAVVLAIVGKRESDARTGSEEKAV